MWDLRVTHPFDQISARKFLTVVAALVVTTFAYIFVSAPITHAADASWNGASIMYNSHQFIATGDAAAGDSRGLTPGSKVYLYTEQAPSGGQQKADLIYFAPPSDPKTATSAEFATYDLIPPDKFSNKSPPTTVSLTPQDTGNSTGKTSCDSTFTFGIGWIVCPVTNFLSSAMDWIFGIVSDFLVVRPVQTNQDNSLYRAWSYMRNFANIAFVIGFMIIIYSQLTSLGLSNYGIKRILPRLIIAAILVNVSYWLCAIAIDISNIAGYAIQEIFIGLRNGLVGNEGNGWNVTSWKSISGFILSGGTAAVATGVGVHLLLAGTVGGALYLLLPIIVGALIAVLVALLVMAARQAIVIIMVILSPLAFVAYLLPNTEKYFDKWKDLFLTMLIMFPAFSVIFGGAQLAGVAIIQNANSINLIILGMAVQVAPLAITPLLLKFSGSLLGKIAGIANNPSRGLVDRTRKFAQERADQHKAGVLANPGSRRRDAFRRKAVSIDYKKRDREGLQKAHDEKATAEYAKTKGYSDNQQRLMEAKDIQELGDSAAQLRYVKSKHTNAAMQQLDTDVRATKLKLDASTAKVETNWEELQAGNAYNTVIPAGLSVNGIADYLHTRNNQAQDIMRDSTVSAAESRRKQNAERVHNQQISEELLQNNHQIDGQNIREYAGGIGGRTGTESVLAAAVAAQRKEFGDIVNEKTQLMNHFNLSSEQMFEYTMGANVTVSKDDVNYTFRDDDIHAREAAIMNKLKAGSFGEIETMIKETGRTVTIDGETGGPRAGKLNAYADTISRLVIESGLPNKAAFFGSKTIDDIAQGRVNGDPGLNNEAAYFIREGKMSDTKVATQNGMATERMLKVGTDPSLSSEFASYSPEKQTSFNENALALQHSAWRIVHDPRLLATADQHAQGVLRKYMVKPPE